MSYCSGREEFGWSEYGEVTIENFSITRKKTCTGCVEYSIDFKSSITLDPKQLGDVIAELANPKKTIRVAYKK